MEAGFEFRERAAVPALRPYLAALTGYSFIGPPPEMHRGLPSRCLTIVLSLDEPVGVAWPGRVVDKFHALVGGLHSTAVRIGESPNLAGIQLALTPAGSRALLSVPPGQLGSLVIDLDDLLGLPARRLVEQVREKDHWGDRFDLVEQTLLRAWKDEPLPEPRAEVGWAWRRLCETAGGVGVQELATEVGWSRRHLTERFHAEYGLAPKVVARVLRFERTVGRLRQQSSARLADIAAEVGYADQAHLTREWQAIAGCSPRQWLNEELPIVQDGLIDGERDSEV